MAGQPYNESVQYYDSLLQDVIDSTNLTSISAGISGWDTYGSVIRSALRGAGQTDPYAKADPLAPASLGDLVRGHLASWTGQAADLFVKEAGLVADFGDNTAKAMNGPQANTFQALLGDLQGTLKRISGQYPKEKKAYGDWAAALANNLVSFRDNIAGNSDLVGNLPPWEPVTVAFEFTSSTSGQGGRQLSGNVKFTITSALKAGGEPTPLVLSVPATDAAYSGISVNSAQVSAAAVKAQIQAHFTTYYKNQVGPLADLITSSGGTFNHVYLSLPAKVDTSNLPKGNSGSGGGGVGGAGAGGIGGAAGGGAGGITGMSGLGAGAGKTALGSGTSSPALAGGPTQLASVGGMPGTGGSGPGGLGGAAGGLGGAAGGLGGAAGGLGPVGSAGAGAGAPGSSGGLLGTGSGGLAGSAGAGLAGSAGAAGRGGMPMMPPMMPPGGQGDRDRQRKSWIPEDENVWGDDGAVVPPVISGDS